MASITDLVYIDSTGYHYSDYPSFLAWLQGEYRGVYGADVYLEADSQDGQWVAILAQAFYDTAALGASDYNSFSPLSAQGVGLSRVVKINGLRRLNPSFSTVDLVIVGTVGTTITNGVAQDALNQKWDLPTSVTIPMAGTITVTGTAQILGAITAESNTITQIFTPTRGWQTVNNPAPATPGAPVESDATLRERQSFSTANPSLTVLDGTIGAVANLDGVQKIRGYENDTGSTDANGLPAHSFEIVVQGGDSMGIAQTIALHKTPGTRTDGSTSEVVNDARGMPLTIRFQRPTLVTITVTLDITANSAYSSDFEDLITASIANYINNIGIGNDVLITKLFSPAYLNGAVQGNSYDITDLEIGKNMAPQSNINIPIAFDELPVCDPSTDITINVT